MVGRRDAKRDIQPIDLPRGPPARTSPTRDLDRRDASPARTSPARSSTPRSLTGANFTGVRLPDSNTGSGRLRIEDSELRLPEAEVIRDDGALPLITPNVSLGERPFLHPSTRMPTGVPRWATPAIHPHSGCPPARLRAACPAQKAQCRHRRCTMSENLAHLRNRAGSIRFSCPTTGSCSGAPQRQRHLRLLRLFVRSARPEGLCSLSVLLSDLEPMWLPGDVEVEVSGETFHAEVIRQADRRGPRGGSHVAVLVLEPGSHHHSAIAVFVNGFLVLATSLVGDVAAALGEHVLATLDEHCGYFRRRGRGQADRVNTAMSAAGPSTALVTGHGFAVRLIRLVASPSRPTCPPSRARTALPLRQYGNTHRRTTCAADNGEAHDGFGQAARKLWSAEVITDRYHSSRTGRAAARPAMEQPWWTSGCCPRLAAAPVTGVGSWIGRGCGRMCVSGLPTALVWALGVCDGRVRAVHAR